MAIKTQTCYIAQCDMCKQEYEGYNNCIQHWDSADLALSEALDNDWIELNADGRLVCYGCSEDLVDSGKLKQNDDDDATWDLVDDIP